MKSKLILAVVAIAIIAGGSGLYLVNKADTKTKNEKAAAVHEMAMKHDEAMKKEAGATATTVATGDAMKKDDKMAKAGHFINYSDYQANKDSYKNDKVVLFFSAPWCPICQALNKNIKANLDKIPVGTTIVSVDYDTSTDLKKKYGVTYQHTLVQIDSNGNKLKKWSPLSESPVLSDITSQVI